MTLTFYMFENTTRIYLSTIVFLNCKTMILDNVRTRTRGPDLTAPDGRAWDFTPSKLSEPTRGRLYFLLLANLLNFGKTVKIMTLKIMIGPGRGEGGAFSLISGKDRQNFNLCKWLDEIWLHQRVGLGYVHP